MEYKNLRNKGKMKIGKLKYIITRIYSEKNKKKAIISKEP